VHRVCRLDAAMLHGQQIACTSTVRPTLHQLVMNYGGSTRLTTTPPLPRTKPPALVKFVKLNLDLN